MKNSIIIELLQNTAILLAFTMLYENFWVKNKLSKTLVFKIITGAVIGLIGIVIMLTPWTLTQGIIFDTRSVILSISGLFFGPIPTIIAMLITGVFRYSSGGDGALMGLSVIFSSGTIGLLWRRYRPLWKEKNYYFELLLMGVIVHAFMSACTVFLPTNIAFQTLKSIALPLIIIYSPATMVLGILMLRQLTNQQNRIANQLLFETERRYNDLLKSMNILSVILDNDGNITFCNEYLENITGYTQKELIGSNWFDIFSEVNNSDDIKDVFHNAIMKGIVIKNLENSLVAKNGDTKYILWNNSILRTVEGAIIGVASIGVDITQRKSFEYELKESNKTKDKFLSIIAHDLKSPYNSMLGFSNLLIQNFDKYNIQRQKEYLSYIHQGIHNSYNLLENLLTWSRSQKDNFIFNPKDMNLYLLSSETINLLSPSAIGKSIILTNKIHEHINIKADKDMLSTIFRNLLSNAIKFTHKDGKIIIDAKIVTDADKKRIIKIYIEDNGIGIAENMQFKLFDISKNISTEGTEKESGTGLGLILCKEFVEKHNGKIWVESEEGKGSKFIFTFPV